MKPQNFEEKLVWYYLIGTYAWYLLGAQYPLASVLAWFLAIYLVKKLWNQTENTPIAEKITISPTVWVWIISMLVMGVALIIGHLNFSLGIGSIINQLFFFTREGALLALFPLVACLNVRPGLIYRAVCIICLQSFIFIAIGYLGFALHLPSPLYSSPLQVIGRGGTMYYDVSLFSPSIELNERRLQLFTPWAPALALVANIYFFLAREESNRIWRWIGMIGAVAMIVVSVSRLGMLCLPIVLFLTWILTSFTQPFVQITAGVVSLLAGMFGPLLIDLLETFKEGFTKARPSSSAVRKVLGEIAVYRWQKEAPIWGHGITDSGPKVVEHMPIGSHHTWFSLLFIKGMVGFVALAVPFLWSFIDLLIKAQKSKTARVGLSILLVLFFFTFAENIDILTYVYWPGLLIMGIAFKEAVYVNKSSEASIKHYKTS